MGTEAQVAGGQLADSLNVSLTEKAGSGFPGNWESLDILPAKRSKVGGCMRVTEVSWRMQDFLPLRALGLGVTWALSYPLPSISFPCTTEGWRPDSCQWLFSQSLSHSWDLQLVAFAGLPPTLAPNPCQTQAWADHFLLYFPVSLSS